MPPTGFLNPSFQVGKGIVYELNVFFVSTRKTAGEADFGAGVQRSSGTETAHKPASLAGHGVS